jgi:hypothetical protein
MDIFNNKNPCFKNNKRKSCHQKNNAASKEIVIYKRKKEYVKKMENSLYQVRR